MPFSRRHFLKSLGLGAAALAAARRTRAGDWDSEPPAAASIRTYLESVFDGLSMALDFRRINRQRDEEFRIQINAFTLYPVASCFKAWAALYYFLKLPSNEWDAGEASSLHSMVVYSSNAATGAVLQTVAERTPGPANAIEKFNNFLRGTMGIEGGIYAWDLEGSPTIGQLDNRYAPATRQPLLIRGLPYQVDNAFTAADLGHGWDILLRGEFFAASERMRQAIRAAKTLLAIPAPDYRSPIERVYPTGYVGKDGILPAADFAAGRVVNDAGLLSIGEDFYLVAFMSAGESESTALSVLGEVIRQIEVYETALR